MTNFMQHLLVQWFPASGEVVVVASAGKGVKVVGAIKPAAAQ